MTTTTTTNNNNKQQQQQQQQQQDDEDRKYRPCGYILIAALVLGVGLLWSSCGTDLPKSL